MPVFHVARKKRYFANFDSFFLVCFFPPNFIRRVILTAESVLTSYNTKKKKKKKCGVCSELNIYQSGYRL